MATLTASSAMRRALEKAAIPAPRHAADKSSKKPETWIFPAGASVSAASNEAARFNTAKPQPPAPAQKTTVDEPPDPEYEAYRRARIESRNALFMKLRQLSPALFAEKKPVPLAIGIDLAIIERLGLDAAAEKERGSDLRVILSQYVNRFRYQKALSREGAVRVDLDGMPAGEVTPEQRERAAKKVEKFKAKAAKARDGHARPF